MPQEAYWETLFDVPLILDRLGMDAHLQNVIEMGCGYGTFTNPIAKRISGTLTTFDIDDSVVEPTRLYSLSGVAQLMGVSSIPEVAGPGNRVRWLPQLRGRDLQAMPESGRHSGTTCYY